MTPLLIGAIVAGLLVWWQHDSNAATPPTSLGVLSSAANTHTATLAPDKRRCVPPDPDLSCEQWTKQQANKKVTAFKNGELGNARGFELPANWKQAFRRYYAKHPAAKRAAERRGNNDWWKFPLESWACTPIAGMGYKINCENAAEHYKQFANESVKITVLCGGAAAIGALAGGGAAGAGKGALACLWGNVFYKVLDHALDFRAVVTAMNAGIPPIPVLFPLLGDTAYTT